MEEGRPVLRPGAPAVARQREDHRRLQEGDEGLEPGPAKDRVVLLVDHGHHNRGDVGEDAATQRRPLEHEAQVMTS